MSSTRHITKADVKAVLVSHPGKFFTTKQLMAALNNLTGSVAMCKVSRGLYQLRNDECIERWRNSATFSYCYMKSPKEDALFEKSPQDKRDNNDAFAELQGEGDSELDNYSYIEQLEEAELGCCDQCENEEVVWRAELTDGGIKFLCDTCGEVVKKYLEANGAILE